MLKYTGVDRIFSLYEVHSIVLELSMLAEILMLSLTVSAMPPSPHLGLGVDVMTSTDGPNLAYTVVSSSSDGIHVTLMVYISMSPSSNIDCNILVLLVVIWHLLDIILC